MKKLAERMAAIREMLLPGAIIQAADMAIELGVSPRTIYRYTAMMRAAGSPIVGEAGVGYVWKEKR